MKNGTLILLLAVSLTACDKAGDITHKVKFTTESADIKKSESKGVDTYSGFGAYITSITPSHFSSKLNILMYLDDWDQQKSTTHMISYIDGHDNDPNYEISLTVDFSGNQEIEYTPILYSTDIWNGVFMQQEILFKYLYLCTYHITQEFEVPAGYGSQNIIGQNGTYRIEPSTGKRLIKINHQPFLEPIFGSPNRFPFGYFFGNTDSTFIFNKECAQVPPSENHPNGGSSPMIRSNKITPITLIRPEAGESIVMYSTISFNTDNLIQVYAGRDNIPYTQDDVFVYAPNYWERLNVRLEIR